MSVQEKYEVTVEKTLTAPPEAVFDALTDPEQLQQWFGPSSMLPTTQCSVDLRDGGGYSITMTMRDGSEVTVSGTYLEVSPHSRLRFTWTWDEKDEDMKTEVTISLTPHGEGTHMVLNHTGFRTEEDRAEHNSGWISVLNRMAQHCAGYGGAINQAVSSAASGHNRFTTTYSHVPGDKLTFKPAPTAKSALQIAAHVAVVNYNFAGMMTGEHPGFESLDEIVNGSSDKEAELDTPEKVSEALEASFRHLVSTMESLTPEQYGAMTKLPFGPFPVAQLIFFPGVHLQNHAGQIDYLQTCWGDQEFHV